MDALPAGSDAERIARLEERIAVLHALLGEIRADQKEMSDAIARASGGMRVLVLLGGLAGSASMLRSLGFSLGALLAHAWH